MGAILLMVCESFLFGYIKKLVAYFGLYEFSLDFQRSEDQLSIVFEK